RTFLATDGVGGEALAIVDVVDLDLFVFVNAGQVQPVAVNGAGAYVVQYRVGHLGAVQFGLEHDGVHGGILRVRKRRRVCPNPPACSRLRSSGYQWFTRPLKATYVGIAALEAGSERSFGTLSSASSPVLATLLNGLLRVGRAAIDLQVVDQAGLAEERGGQDDPLAGPGRGRLQVAGATDFQVVGTHASGFQGFASLTQH